ncbi:MAG: hypothetical protein ACOX65_04910 [Anaerotruncus rubiinfantis]|uniref:hypothetical protein n=1 Tax=Anaerotruncus rubiinfantis TaxID=1720200 RepID=UPI0018973AC4|nr:hypothetical protein [Anaerotruncus rubiinfantis]
MLAIKNFVGWGMDRWKRFTVSDVAVFKICLLSIGALIGMYWAKACRKLAPFIWAAAVASYAYLIWRMVFCDED